MGWLGLEEARGFLIVREQKGDMGQKSKCKTSYQTSHTAGSRVVEIAGPDFVAIKIPIK